MLSLIFIYYIDFIRVMDEGFDPQIFTLLLVDQDDLYPPSGSGGPHQQIPDTDDLSESMQCGAQTAL